VVTKDSENDSSMQTIRQQMIILLSSEQHSAQGLSMALKIREKEVCDHLSHIRHSLASQKRELKVKPAQCLECRYVFDDRARLTKPGRCPRCKGTHIEDPRYRVI
jgi:predicted Zn-ribbon and HTH transcriptional regulator